MRDLMNFNEIFGKNVTYDINPLSANPTKWSKHTQKIRLQIADELFECV